MSTRSVHAVVLPGAGSDARFAADAFASAFATAGTTTQTVDPDPTGVIAGYERALDDAAREHGPIIVGGISIGAAVAMSWALEHPDRVVAVLAALPPWIGVAGDAPAALSARLTSHRLNTEGLGPATAAMASSTPPWLAETLTRSWASQWPDLPGALREVADYTAPSVDELRRVRVPTALVGAVDDPVHPFDVAEVWHREIEGSALASVTLDQIGRDPGVLGRCAMDALSRTHARA
ncbi:MAG: alpha/beta fold hydrolase [Rhodococcus sp. (in: high G+C Gram-positive bacteria)]